MKKLLILPLLLIVLTGCGVGEDWTGFFYPQGLSIGIYDMETKFTSKESCFDWIDSKRLNNGREDYECGLNCRKNSDLDIYRCEITTKE